MASVRHLGIIMDGNRRFSRRLMKQPWQGHAWGKEKLREVLGWCEECGVQELTVYAFSMQNFSRPKKEFEFLMELFRDFCDELLGGSELRDKSLCIRFIGRTSLLPVEVQERMRRVEAVCPDDARFRLNVAVAYGGREELVDAVQAIAREVQSGDLSPDVIDEDVIGRFVYLSSEPDLIIRTGGDHRTSNFLLWQSPYSEWLFVDELWPEFSKETFLSALQSFEHRERRFGR